MSPDAIGPYRLDRPLGSGGMGEVFRAWDQRLERWVALKKIRSGLHPSPERRRRLRLEAKAAAALSHPALVAIHDLLETPDGDWIVMELVEGETLAQRMARGPVSVADGLAWGLQLAEGLAVAHDAGVLHRDLKAENVMVDPAGGVRILDFGVAKRLSPVSEPIEPEPTDPEASSRLTHPGQVLGTARAMSPEQSLGRAVDPRSDLFSLGVLLYEVFAGVTPFEGAGLDQVLERVRALHQTPLRVRSPELPWALSDLIEQLLEKDPARRPADAHEVARRMSTIVDGSGDSVADPSTVLAIESATDPGSEDTEVATQEDVVTTQRRRRPSRWRPAILVVLLGVLVALGWGRWGRTEGPRYVVVAQVSGADRWQTGSVEPDGSGAVSRALVASAVRSAIFAGLLRLEGIAPLGTQGTDPTASFAVLARSTAADEVLASSMTCERGSCRIELRRLGGLDSRVLWITSFEVPEDDLGLLASAVAGRLAEAWPDHHTRRGVSPATIPDDDIYRALLELRLVHRQQDAEPDQLLAALADLRRRAPRFVEVYRLEAKVAHDRYFDRRDPDDLELAFSLLDQALTLAPDDIATHELRFSVALDSERLAVAEESLERLKRLAPGDARSLRREALLLERRGSQVEALERLRESARRHPSVSTLFELASMEYRSGATSAARTTLEGLLARAPGSYNARSFLAQLELLEGSLEEAIEHYGRLLEHRVGIAELSNRGLAHLLLGDAPAAAADFEQAFTKAPSSPMLALNLADARAISGQTDVAQSLYGTVIDLLPADDEPANWQELTVGAQALAHLGAKRRAVERIQRALRQAGDNPQVAYEAALVYAVIGESTSALVQAERALGSFDLRWFELPWFAELRPQIDALIEESDP